MLRAKLGHWPDDMQLGAAEIVRIVREGTWARVAFAGLIALVAVSVLPWQTCLAWAATMTAWEFWLRPLAEDRLALRAPRGRDVAWVAALNFVGGTGYAVFPALTWSSGEALGMVLATGWIAGAANHLFVYFMGNRVVTLATLAPLLSCAVLAPLLTQGAHLVSVLGAFMLIALIAAAGVFGYDRHVLAGAHARKQAALVRAEEELQAKARLLANLSAELRAPLNDVVGYAELIEEEAMGKTAEDARRIRVSSQHLLRFVGMVSDVAKLESGGAALNRELLPADVLVREVNESSRSIAAAHGVSVQFREANALGEVEVDHTRLHQCLVHLASYAARHARGERVRLEVRRGRRAGAEALSFIIPSTEVRRPETTQTFDPFQALAAGDEGAGLAFVRDLARCMGGDVEVDTKGQVEFWVRVRPSD